MSYLSSSKKVFGLIPAVLLLIIIILTINIFLCITVNRQNRQIDELTANTIYLNECIEAGQTELENYKLKEAGLVEQINEYEAEFLTIKRNAEIISLEDYEIIINKYMSEGAINLIETFLTAISTNDKELYTSLLSYDIPDVWSSDMPIEQYHKYLMVPFEQYHGSPLILRKIETSNPFRGWQSQIDALQGIAGWLHVRIIVENEDGQYELIQDVGIIYNQGTKSWEINDFH